MSQIFENLERVLSDSERQEAQVVAQLVKDQSAGFLQGAEELVRRDPQAKALILRGPKPLAETVFRGGELEVRRCFSQFDTDDQITRSADYVYIFYPDRVILEIQRSIARYGFEDGDIHMPVPGIRREVGAKELTDLFDNVKRSTEYNPRNSQV